MKNIAGIIDHTVLKAQATNEDVVKLCEEAIKYSFASVCINPCFIELASEKLKNSDVKVCTVVGFPLGANTTETKIFEALNAMDLGAEEIDMVINIGKVKSNDFEYVEKEVLDLAEACKNKNSNVIVKVIIETCYLTNEEKEKICNLLLNTKADFVKTSTGFGTGGATVEDISLMKKVVGDKMLIKASGGVRNYQDFENVVKVGANRIGTSNGIAIVEGFEGTGY